MKRYCFKIIILYVFVAWIIGCDFDKYFGYDYEAESLIETIQISGSVENVFTGLPVANALVKFGEEETYSYLNGNYLLVYPLGADEERNKIIQVTISAENYFTDSSETIIYPEHQEFNFSLIYAAPIIESSLLTTTADSAICHATIFDYQGISNISSVTTLFFYLRWPLTDTREMQVDSLLSENRAIFRSSIELHNSENGGINTTKHRIIAFDKDGFSDMREF